MFAGLATFQTTFIAKRQSSSVADHGDFKICGIVGVAGQVSLKHERAFKTMLILDTLRGIDSTGVLAVHRDGSHDVAKGGCIRVKPYGVEYRTLSNRWLTSENLMRWVYRNAVKGVQELMNGRDLSDKYGDIQDIINKSNRKDALKIIKAEKLEIPNA